ncbi:DUF669 domain-containing protein [Acidithiobacillus thiooxidans]|uniref:DUF669 domain-containing protein n=1 Tax=Acidithiobacillus thiooxidans TaxID=930 RepID=UPI0035625CAB|nr:DUF669 domain-containing protein [Acidithiobacillus sp.]
MVMVTIGNKASMGGAGNSIEPGIYQAQVVQVEDNIALKGGQSGYASRFHFKIANAGLGNSAMVGREVNELLNLMGTKPDNQRIALEQFAGMAIASGVPESAVLNQSVDTQAMTGRSLCIILGPQKNDPRYVEVKGYAPAGAENDPAAWEKNKALFQAPQQPAAGANQGAWGNTASPAQQQSAPAAGNQGGWGNAGQAQQQPQPQSQPQPQPQPNNTAGAQQNTWGNSGFAGPS